MVNTLYLFPGKTPDVPLSPTTIQKMFKVAAKEAGILKNLTPPHAAAFLCDGTFGSGRRSADDQSSAGTCQLFDNDDLSARQNFASGISAEPHRLAARATTSGLDTSAEQQEQPAKGSIRIFDLLRRDTADFVKDHRPQAVPQVQSTLAKLAVAQTVSTTLKVCKNWLAFVMNYPFPPNAGILGKVLGVRGIFCFVAIPDTDATQGRNIFPRCEFAPTGRWVVEWQIQRRFTRIAVAPSGTESHHNAAMLRETW